MFPKKQAHIETSKKFEESTDLALDSVSRQIKKQKEKMRLH